MRTLRHDAGLSPRTSSSGWHGPRRSSPSSSTAARPAASAQDLTGRAGAVGVPDGVRDELLADARSLRVEYDSWKRLQVDGFASVPTASLPGGDVERRAEPARRVAGGSLAGARTGSTGTRIGAVHRHAWSTWTRSSHLCPAVVVPVLIGNGGGARAVRVRRAGLWCAPLPRRRDPVLECLACELRDRLALPGRDLRRAVSNRRGDAERDLRRGCSLTGQRRPAR